MGTMQIHGGDIYRNKEVLDFSVNSNPLGTPESVIRAVKEAAERLSCYPDIYCEALKEAIGGFEHVPRTQIICGNGAAELFFAAASAIMPKKGLLVSPCFSEYERALKSVGAEIIYYDLSEETEFDTGEGILESITPDVDAVFLCNPGNPTGCVIPKELLYRILEKCRKHRTILVLDECFIEFLETPEVYEMKEYLWEFPELLIIKAFTKLFAAPGLRLGYGLCGNPELLRRMCLALQPWNVSVPAQEAGIAALSECEEYLPGRYIEATRAFVAKERRHMAEELVRLGFVVYGSHANYIFFKGRKGLYEAALDAGFLIRDCSGYRGLSSGYYRVAVRREAENERLLTWLRGL